MSTQRISLAKVAGSAADVIEQQFQLWQQARVGREFPADVQSAVDDFAEKLKANSAQSPIVYFAEWVDMWSMGSDIHDLQGKCGTAIDGQRYSASCHRPPLFYTPTTIDDEPTQESLWLKRRLEEATDAWAKLVPSWVVVILREPISGSLLDEELVASLSCPPDWLSSTR